MSLELTTCQSNAFKLMSEGKNVFITGPGGVGKSLLIKMFKDAFLSVKNIAITSTTGISALLIGGTTLHSFLGIGLGTGSRQALVTKIKSKSYLKVRWVKLDTLIIDEISMLSPELFDKLEYIARIVRNNTMPFGGIQLILSGDFCQLPVVGSNNFVFESKSWKRCIDNVCHLSQIMRQTDSKFQKCLNEARIASLSDESKQLLTECVDRELTNDSGIKPTKLYPTNAEVDRINNIELEKLLQLHNSD